MGIKVKNTLSIGKHVVVLSQEAFGLKFYVHAEEDDSETGATLFVVRGDEYLGKIEITADCGQNVGFVDDVKFTQE